MSDFKQFSTAVNAQLTKMSSKELFVVDSSKDELWDLYLSSFPEGTNPIYLERTTHDCSCCKSFIRNLGNVVSIVNGKMVSIWDIEVGGYQQVVADALSKHIKSKKIENVLLHSESKVGNEFNIQLLSGDKEIRWEHFHFDLPSKFVVTNESIATKLGDKRANKQVLERSIKEISSEAISIVEDLILQDSLYRGTEHLPTVQKIKAVKEEFEGVPKKRVDFFLWEKSLLLKGASRFRNTVIGSLLSDLSGGKDLDASVKSFESKVAPANYKRPKSLITQKMIDSAYETVEELGLEDNLPRRHATFSDLTVNNVLFADKQSKISMGAFDVLKPTKKSTKTFEGVEEVSVEDFIKNILPKSESISLQMENNHSQNLMSLVAPVHSGDGKLLKWDNDFTWSYNGEVADSMKETVKSKGGNVDGVLRFSIMWNEDDDNKVDLDAHCRESKGSHIYYSSKRGHNSSGTLDIDITQPSGVAVENIIYTDIKRMEDKGTFIFYVNNYSSKSSKGFRAEIEFEGKVYEYSYNGSHSWGANIDVAVVSLKDGKFSIKHKLDSTSSTKEVWGVTSNTWTKVKTVLNSPNHWDNNETGNKHLFFILEDCINPDPVRGFYNEFLREDLNEHRKVFEVLASRMKVEKTEEQMSGLGFSSTVKNSVLCKVEGSFNRVIKINF